MVLLDGAYQCISAIAMDNIPIGPHIVLFAKFGYFKCEREAVVNVKLRTNRGMIERQVKILAGHASATATLTSSTDEGTATVEAKAEFLKGSTTVEFLRST